MDIITSNNNPRVKWINKINRDSGFRREEDVFVVEGIRMFREIPVDRVREIYLSESFYDENNKLVEEMGLSDKTVVMKDTVFAAISQTKTPQGCMAVVRCAHYTLDMIDNDKDYEVYLVLETLQDPGNMGTIFRSAEAAGVTALIIGNGSCDPYNPKVVRSTMGAIFRVPFVVSDDLVETVRQLKHRGVVVYGAHLDGDDLYDIQIPHKTAFLIGNEGNGLSQNVSNEADELLRIPMEGKVESLNAAISATLLSYEAMRQRKSARQN